MKPPTIKKIEKMFNDEFTFCEGEYWIPELKYPSGRQIADILFTPEQIRVFIRQAINDILEYLKMEKMEEDWFGDSIGYNNVVRKLNKKIERIRR